jgi:hypothetical protein
LTELNHTKTELGKLSIEHETLQNNFDMMQSYMQSVKNIEATEREQHAMREKITQRQN